jgi:hypothetical protein
LAITRRFHGATACLLTRTPFIAVESNMPKIAALLHDAFGSKSRLFAMEQVERAYLAAFSSWIAAESAAINSLLFQWLKALPTYGFGIGKHNSRA